MLPFLFTETIHRPHFFEFDSKIYKIYTELKLLVSIESPNMSEMKDVVFLSVYK